jgi:tRNA pseudouridine55 synthase
MCGAAYLLDKSSGITSRMATSTVAEAWGFSKYGHAGTLDPDATGLLIVLLGKATRLSRFITSGEKRYSFGIEFGIRTDTDDTTGNILERRSAGHIKQKDIQRVLKRYTGNIIQKVPSYSAVKIDGVRAYKTARKGLLPDTPEKRVHVCDWKLMKYENGKAYFAVTVSSGTYVRALARDIGNDLDVFGAAFDIRRLSIGSITIESSSREPDNPESLLSMTALLDAYESVILSDSDKQLISHGARIISTLTGTVALLDKQGRLVAMSEGDGSSLRPLCVFVSD